MRPELQALDWGIIVLYGILAVGAGTWFARAASRSASHFFVGSRNLPWWIAGTSIVATTFAADTPLAVTGIVALGGISGNWLWWSWAIAHVSATFFFARLWRRSGVITDAEITELRYAGRPAVALRAFKAVYFGVFINCLTMAWVIAAMVKIARAFFAVDPTTVIVLCVVLAVVYTVLGGFHSVVVTDLLQFVMGMGGALALAVLVLRHFGGMGTAPGPDDPTGSGLLGALGGALEHGPRTVQDVIAFVPAPDHPQVSWLFFLALLVAGWWRYAEGNGYLVQRLAACRDEGHAQGASLWFAIAHNALRPWPWFVVALASLVVYPTVGGPEDQPLRASHPESGQPITIRPGHLDVATGGSLLVEGVEEWGGMGEMGGIRDVRVGDRSARSLEPVENGVRAHFGPIPESGRHTVTVQTRSHGTVSVEGLVVELEDREMGYPLLMGQFLPPGLLGLVVASLLAAFMSTIDTHTNWGASYLVQDVYLRFVEPDASPRRAVLVSRLCVVGMAILAGLCALFVQNIASVWVLLVNLGAGLGSVAAARWYWSRVTPHAEFAALGVTTVLALGLLFFCTPTLFGGPNPTFVYEVPDWAQIAIIAGGSLAAWIPVALWGPRNPEKILRRFAARVRPPGPSWNRWRSGPAEPLAPAAWRFAGGLVVVYSALFGIGDLVLGRPLRGGILLGISVAVLVAIVRRGRAGPAPHAPPAGSAPPAVNG